MTSQEAKELLETEIAKAKQEYKLAKSMYDMQIEGKNKYSDDAYPRWAMITESNSFDILDYSDICELAKELPEWKDKQIERHGYKPYFWFQNIGSSIVYTDELGVKEIKLTAAWKEPWADCENEEQARVRIESIGKKRFKKNLALNIWGEIETKRYSDGLLASKVDCKLLQLFLEDKIDYKSFVGFHLSQCVI